MASSTVSPGPASPSALPQAQHSPQQPIAPKNKPITPNAHPYAIKTTSSALLSRSNSNPHSYATKHHYVPPSPSRPRHRTSSSVSSVEDVIGPTPLPVPEGFISSSPTPQSRIKSAEGPSPRRLRRADTVPHNSRPLSTVQDGNESQENPMHWDTAQLCDHLAKAGMDIDAIAAVRERQITGRQFMRLPTADLENLPAGEALYAASRSMRSGSLRRRIWVDSYHANEISASSGEVYSNGLYSRSGSSVDLSSDSNAASPFSPDPATGLSSPASSTSSHFPGLSRSKSAAAKVAPPAIPVPTPHRSNSVSAADYSERKEQRYRELAKFRTRKRGQVKGLVQNWEQNSVSGSEGSVSESDFSDADSLSGDHSLEKDSEAHEDQQAMNVADHDQDFIPIREPVKTEVHEAEVPTTRAEAIVDVNALPDISGLPRHLSSVDQPPPYSLSRDEAEEPTIEELLASESVAGARAWEADFGLGETIKRLPSDDSSASPGSSGFKSARSSWKNSIRVKPGSSKGSSRASKGSQRRVVTAIFTGESNKGDDEAEKTGLMMDEVAPELSQTSSLFETAGSVPVMSGSFSPMRVTRAVETDTEDEFVAETKQEKQEKDDAQEELLASIAESLASTRLMLEQFRTRLDVLEQANAAPPPPPPSPPAPEPAPELVEETAQPAPEPADSPVATPSDDARSSSINDASFSQLTRAAVSKVFAWTYPAAHPDAASVRSSSPERAGSRTSRSRSLTPARSSSNSEVRRMPVSLKMPYLFVVSIVMCALLARDMGKRFVPRGLSPQK